MAGACTPFGGAIVQVAADSVEAARQPCYLPGLSGLSSTFCCNKSAITLIVGSSSFVGILRLGCRGGQLVSTARTRCGRLSELRWLVFAFPQYLC